MGTPDFSVGTLKALIEAGHEVVLAVTQPDKPKGRGKAMQFPPVKKLPLSLASKYISRAVSGSRNVWNI